MIAVVKNRIPGALALGCFLAFLTSAFAGTFTNAIISDGADPGPMFLNGNYYLTVTTGGDVKVRTATRLAGTNGIGAVSASTIFTPPSPYNKDVWAPEMHYLQGKIYIYYAADNGTNANHRMFVAEQSGTGLSFTYKGKIFDGTTDRWAIDGTVFEATNGALYFIWSGWPGTTDGLQNLYIAPMSNPWTISGPRVLISTPSLSWESWINEGPEVLQRNGKVFIVFAANQSWTDNECLGMLVNTDGNYLNPASWVKQSQPVFKTVTGAGGSVYGPGHCGFTQSLDGTEDWIIYHAAKYSGAGWTRNIRMQRFTWLANGYPTFGQPIPEGVPIANPAGDDFTPARLAPIAIQNGGQPLVSAIAPLPLLTNIWAIEHSSDLKTWTTVTNVPGKQYSVQVLDTASMTQRYYRVKSSR